MEHRIELGPDGHWIRVTTSGQASVGGFKRFVDEVVGRPDWRPGLDLLCDHTALDFRTLTPDEVRLIAQASADYDRVVGGGRLAIVSPDKLGFGILRMWDLLTERELSVNVQVFETADEAERWLTDRREGRA